MKKSFIFVAFLMAVMTTSVFAASESDLVDRYFEKASTFYHNNDTTNAYKYICMFFKLIKSDEEIKDKKYYADFESIVPEIFRSELELLIAQNQKDLGVTGEISRNIEKMTFLTKVDKNLLQDLSFKVNNISDSQKLNVKAGDSFNYAKIADVTFYSKTGVYIKEIVPTTSDYKEMLPSSAKYCRITVSYEDDNKVMRDIYVYTKENDEISLKNKKGEYFGKIENFYLNEFNVRVSVE